MTPDAYSRGLARLDAGTLRERSVAPLGQAAAERLEQAGIPPNWADALVWFWHYRTERREVEAEAAAIAKASARLLNVLERSPQWQPYLQLPDAALWNAASARPVLFPAGVPTLSLANYLAQLIDTLAVDDLVGIAPMWGVRFAGNRRKSRLVQFVIRYVAEAMPAGSGRPEEATSGQRRYGRNVAIARTVTVILARPIDRHLVAQTLKKTM